MFLHCADPSPAMLGELDIHFTDLGIKDFETHEALADDLPFASASLDCVFTFNACHHFDLAGFFADAHRTLKPGSRLFMYTRTRTQNAQSMWGVHFPSFSEKETRLYEVDQVTSALRTFRYDREEGLDHLVDLARIPHYSTFSLYSDDEFETALDRFACNVAASHEDPENVTWCDENTMYVITRTN